MRITIAGMNACPGRENNFPLTPESICAAYARISRSPLSVEQLRKRAAQDMARSRLFNEKILFHLGHRSVAEHAVFNVDLVDISRLAVEAVEHSRLVSYTEKSQRYVRLGEGFLIPREAREAGLSRRFAALCRDQHDFYQQIVCRIAAKRSGQKAKEDARYALGLATTTQLGMTINARALGMMLARLAHHELHECRHLAQMMQRLVSNLAPSVIQELPPPAEEANNGESPRPPFQTESNTTPTLLWHTPHAEEVLATSLAFAQGTHSFAQLHQDHGSVNLETVGDRYRHQCDRLPRAFENIHFAFELVVSASCFAQLKRHRMATILAQPYDTALGITVPPLVIETGIERAFLDIASRAEAMAKKIAEIHPASSAYALLNAHRRRVLLVINARAMGNMAALRLDPLAQWDIRHQVTSMIREVFMKLPMIAHAMGMESSEYSRGG